MSDKRNVAVTGDEAMIISYALGMVAYSKYDDQAWIPEGAENQAWVRERIESQESMRERCAKLHESFRKLSFELKMAEATSVDHGFVIKDETKHEKP